MNPLPTTSDSAELLAHVAWVQRLARALVRDAGAAEDLAQETLRVSIESPPDATARGPRLRGWLARVARRLVIDRARSDGRRTQREATAALAAESRSESPLDVVARSARQQRVVEAVMALDEPFRTTVLLRFFDELPTKEIAARTNANEALVRKRVERALAQLRERLDREFGRETKEWAGALCGVPGVAVMATKAKLAVAAAVVLLIGGAAWKWTLSRAGAPHVQEEPAAAASLDADGATKQVVAGLAAAVEPLREAQDSAAAPRLPRHVVVEVVTPDGTPCREGLLTAFWRRTPGPRDAEEMLDLIQSSDHSLMTPHTEPLRTVERPIAGEQTELELPHGVVELQIAASVAGRRPSARIVVNDRETPGWERVRLVVDEPLPEERFAGAITLDGERCLPRGLTIGVGANVIWPPPNHGVRIDSLAAAYEVEPRPAGAFHLWITSDETIPLSVDVGASDGGRDLALERGGTLELTLLDVASGEPLPGVDLLVKIGVMVVTRYGDSPWHLRGEHTLTVRSDGEGRAIVHGLPKVARDGLARRNGPSVEVRLDQETIAADPIWRSDLSADSPDPLQATLRLDLERSHRRVTGVAPPSCRAPRFDGDPPAVVAVARLDRDGSFRREGGRDDHGNPTGHAIDAEGRFEFAAPPATAWHVWAEREGQRCTEVATVEVVADDVGPIELVARRGSEVTLRIRGVSPPDRIDLAIEQPSDSEESGSDLRLAADPAGGVVERRLTLDGPTAIEAVACGRDGVSRARQRLVVDPATQSLVEFVLEASTSLRRIELHLVGASIREGGDAGIDFHPLDPGAFGDGRHPAARLGGSGRTADPVPLPPGRYIWTFFSRLRGVVAGYVEVEAAESGATLRIEGVVERASEELLAHGFGIEAIGDVELPSHLRSSLKWLPDAAQPTDVSVYVPVDATIALRRPGRPVVVTLEGATLPGDAMLRLMALDGDAPFAFELQRVALDANGRAELPVAVTPGRWFWCVAGPKRSASGELGGVLGGVVEVAAGAGGEALALHAVIEQRTGAEGRSGYEITSIAGIALTREVGPIWFPVPPQFEGEAPFLAPAGAITKPLDPSLFKR